MMKKDGTGIKRDLRGISRRDMLKMMGAGALVSLLPGYGLGGNDAAFSSSGGKGLIFLAGDGMPFGVIRGMHEIRTRLYGEKTSNFYSKMKDIQSTVGSVSTASLSSIVTDSAPASVAWSTGSKTINKLLASLPDGRPLRTIMELLKEEGYACGLVTTTRVTHATPAAWVSHQMDRDKEDDIALDYLKLKPDVFIGGGGRHFDPSKRKDHQDLFKAFSDLGYDIAKDRESLLSPNILSSQRPLMGTVTSSQLSFYLDRMNQPELAKKEPALPEMTRVALQKLSRHPKGFALLIEAGRIDHASHGSDAWSAILDTVELDLTMAVIEEYLGTNPKTLVIVTSDHGTGGFSINGTGPEYNDSTEALQKYQPIKASFELIKRKMKKDSSSSEIKDIFENFTTYKISDEEASMISRVMQPEYIQQCGDFLIQPDAIMGKILAHSIYEKVKEIYWDGKPLLRRGNVGFTSSHHTGEDQILLSYGYRAKELGLGRNVENTYLFSAMCEYFGIKYTNPTMSEEEAKPFIKVASLEEWMRHMELHIA